MNDTITVVGNIATPPEFRHLPGGTPVVSFRLASNHRRWDKATGQWVDSDANYYTVSVYRDLAEHVRRSLQLPDRIIVVGRLRLRQWQSENGTRVSPEIDADAIGPELRFGTTRFEKVPRPVAAEASGAAAADQWEAAPVPNDDTSASVSAAPRDWGAPAEEPEPATTPF